VSVSGLVDQVVKDLRRPTLVLAVEDVLTESPAYDGVATARLGEPLPQQGGWASVVLVAPDSAALRRAVSVLPFLGRARSVACVVRDRTMPLGMTPRAGWPPLRQFVARVGDDGGSVTRVELGKGVPVGEVLVEAARQAGTGPHTDGPGGVYVAQPPGVVPPPVDTTLRVTSTAAEAADPEAKVPPDVWLGDDEPPDGPHPVTGRTVRRAAPGIGPLDEAVLHPAGFRADAAGAVVDLPDEPEATEGLVRRLHDHRGVRVPPEAHARLVAGLAMAGVPLTAERLGDATTQALGDELAAALTAPVDLDDAEDRARHARELSRAAHDRHSTRAWRAGLTA
jgi:hypothetical protein